MKRIEAVATGSRIADETPWQRLDRAFRTVLKVSKEDLLKAEQADKPAVKKARKKSTGKKHLH